MNHHTKTIIEQIAKYGTKIPDSKKDELFLLLSDPENELSGDFFELYNNKEVSILLGDKEEKEICEKKIKEFFGKITQYTDDITKEIASGDYKCVFANSADIIERLEDNCEEWGYGFKGHIPLTLKSHDNITPLLFETGNKEVNILIDDWITYKALKHFFMEFSTIFTRGAFNNAALITLLKSNMLDRKIKDTYKNLINHIEFKARTPQQQNNYKNIANDDIAKYVVDKDIDAIYDIIEYGEYDIFDKKISDIDPAIIAMLSSNNPKYISLLKKIIGLHNQAEENDIYLQHIFPLSKKHIKGTPISQIILNYYNNNYSEQWENISVLFLDIQQQEILLRSRLQGHMSL